MWKLDCVGDLPLELCDSSRKSDALAIGFPMRLTVVFRLLIKSRSIYFSLHTYAVWELSATLACDVNKRNTKPIIVYLTIQIQTHVCSVFDNFSQMFKSHLLLVLM